MELIYKIDFNTTNFYFKYIIDDLITESSIKAVSKFYKGFILIVCNDSKKKIEIFFRLLEQKLPSSIFLGNVEILDSFDFESYIELEDKKIKINLSLLTNDEIKNIIENNHIDFSNDINKIKKGGISRFETHNGLKDFFLPSFKIREDFEAKAYEVKLLVTNLNSLVNLFDISEKDLQLLCSVERPLVKLKFKSSENKKNEYSRTRFIYVKIADDKETVLFSEALRAEGINFLLYVNDEVYQDGLKVTYNDSQNIIVHGEKGLFPKFDYKLERKVNSSKDYFEEYGSVFKASLAQYNKILVPTIGVYFSHQSDESCIKVNIPSLGQKKLIYIPNVLNDLDNCLEDIKSIDENTLKLVDNYKKKYSKYFEKEFINKNELGFASILNLLAYILGMKDYNQLEDTALLYDGKNSIQIDMNVVKIDNKHYLDYRKLIQSAMSYKMAGVEEIVIAYSIYESLTEFIIYNIHEINSELKAKDLILCGDMFANSILLSNISKSLKNLNILIPKEYPIDY